MKAFKYLVFFCGFFGAEAEAIIQTGALWFLGIFVVIKKKKKVIGFFGR